MTRRLAVLGHPVGHSRSPAMHTAALEALGLGGEWSYEAIDVPPEGFVARVGELPHQGFVGANVTVPHKTAALALAQDASESAQAIGAANTLVLEAGAVRADNTDAPGLLDALPHHPGGSRALVLGAGGAARAAVWALYCAGADVGVWNRTPEKAEALARELGGWAVPEPGRERFDLIVNASAAGLGGTDGLADLPLEPGSFGPGQVVVDMVYGERPSTLLAAAEAAGAETVDGLEILVRQGALSFEIWTGSRPDLGVMRSAARGA